MQQVRQTNFVDIALKPLGIPVYVVCDFDKGLSDTTYYSDPPCDMTMPTESTVIPSPPGYWHSNALSWVFLNLIG